MKIYICPVCADFFDSEGVYHCLKCNHHYPPDHGHKCHNCDAPLRSDGYQAIETSLTSKDIDCLIEWSIANSYQRGTWTLRKPDGRRYVGGVEV